MANFKEIKLLDLDDNVFKLFGKDWFLMTAEKEGKINTMTVGWGGFGEMWNKNTAIIAVRPERYTKEFLDASGCFSLTVFDKSFRKKLGICGTKSGRDMDKVKECGFTVLYDEEIPYFEEARLSFSCKTMCVTPLCEEDFLGNTDFTDIWYGGENQANGKGGGYHLLYIAEITKVFIKDEEE